jgi:hypothetical protein
MIASRSAARNRGGIGRARFELGGADRLVILSEDVADGAEQRVLVERLPQMARRSRLFDAGTRHGIVMSRDEEDRDVELLLQLEPAHFLHVDVEDEARGLPAGQPLEEFSGGGKCLHSVAH